MIFGCREVGDTGKLGQPLTLWGNTQAHELYFRRSALTKHFEAHPGRVNVEPVWLLARPTSHNRLDPGTP
jgi:hypothetical protein